MFWTSSSLSCQPTHQLYPLVQAGYLCCISLILSLLFLLLLHLLLSPLHLTFLIIFSLPLPTVFPLRIQVNCVSFNPFSEYILATGSADRVSLATIHPEGNSLYEREFLILEEIPYMGGNSLYGSGDCHLQYLWNRCSMACGVVFGGAMQ